MASRSGVKRGLLVPLLALVITVVLAIIGAAVGASFIDQLSGVTLPGPADQAAQQGLGTILSVSGILALLFPFIGGALGGARGARVGRRRPWSSALALSSRDTQRSLRYRVCPLIGCAEMWEVVRKMLGKWRLFWSLDLGHRFQSRYNSQPTPRTWPNVEV
jgi:hypothetical protein